MFPFSGFCCRRILTGCRWGISGSRAESLAIVEALLIVGKAFNQSEKVSIKNKHKISDPAWAHVPAARPPKY